MVTGRSACLFLYSVRGETHQCFVTFAAPATPPFGLRLVGIVLDHRPELGRSTNKLGSQCICAARK